MRQTRPVILQYWLSPFFRSNIGQKRTFNSNFGHSFLWSIFIHALYLEIYQRSRWLGLRTAIPFAVDCPGLRAQTQKNLCWPVEMLSMPSGIIDLSENCSYFTPIENNCQAVQQVNYLNLPWITRLREPFLSKKRPNFCSMNFFDCSLDEVDLIRPDVRWPDGGPKSKSATFFIDFEGLNWNQAGLCWLYFGEFEEKMITNLRFERFRGEVRSLVLGERSLSLPDSVSESLVFAEI